jgi:hypothetical protein
MKGLSYQDGQLRLKELLYLESCYLELCHTFVLFKKIFDAAHLSFCNISILKGLNIEKAKIYVKLLVGDYA